MKILQVIDTLNVGGAERVFVDMCNILHEKNHDITALFLLNGGILQQKIHPEITCIELNRIHKWRLEKMKECANIIKQYDIVHCHFRHVYKYITLVQKLFHLDTKVILHDHYGSIDIDKSIPFLFNSVFKPKYYIGVSNSLTSWATKTVRISVRHVFLLENIIVKNESKQDLPITYDLILVSNIKPVKNNIFAAQIAKNNNNSLLLVGGNQDEEYYLKLKSEIVSTDIEINSNVSEVQPILHNARLGLHTSISETGPLVLIEYLAQGLPFLAYETGEVAKILKPELPEYFIDNFDIHQWCERINKLLNTPTDKERLEKIFHKYFGTEQYYNKLIDIYLCITND